MIRQVLLIIASFKIYLETLAPSRREDKLIWKLSLTCCDKRPTEMDQNCYGVGFKFITKIYSYSKG